MTERQHHDILNILAIAEVCHEANRAYCKSMGDQSQPEWSNAPTWQVDSAVQGVKFHLDNPDASASASHESWLKQKESEGWAYGPVKDPSKKEHPCYVPFKDLPIKQQLKDHLFKNIVHALRPLMDLGR